MNSYFVIRIRRPNKKFYYKTKDILNKLQLQFYRHIVRLDESRLTKRIFNKLAKHNKKITWLRDIEKSHKRKKQQNTQFYKIKFKSKIQEMKCQ